MEGYLGLACVSEKREDYESYMGYLREAYSVDPEHPLLLLLLAEHYLYANRLVLAKNFAKKGLITLKNLSRLNIHH